VALLHRHLRGAVEVHCGPHLHEPATFEVLVAGRPTREQLEASPRLKAVVIPFAGIPTVTRELLSGYPHLAVHNLHHNAAATAEMALALLLAAAKRLVPADQALRRGDWTPRYAADEGALGLAGKTALVLGYGAIGRRVARALCGLGLEVFAWRRSEPRALSVAGGEGQPCPGSPGLSELLGRAQVLLVALPATPDTDGLLGAAELAALPDQALLVNVARGAVVDEGALHAALSEGKLFGAGLDVWWRYPEDEAARTQTPPATAPFGELEQVVLSPHRGGHVRDTEPERMRALAELLGAYARGEPMPNRVDLAAGY
jgi:phosphoglycerate dehydrogenase-like enzyme